MQRVINDEIRKVKVRRLPSGFRLVAPPGTAWSNATLEMLREIIGDRARRWQLAIDSLSCRSVRDDGLLAELVQAAEMRLENWHTGELINKPARLVA
jgi:hypothetical protein